jgi:hypothetical protein
MGKKGKDGGGGGSLFASYLAAMPEPSTSAGTEGPKTNICSIAKQQHYPRYPTTLHQEEGPP